MQDISNYKHRLSDYLNYKNIPFSKGFYRCPNPAHNDHEPSCKCYDHPKGTGQVLVCMSQCNATWDIFDVAGLLINSDDFKEQLSEVEKTLGIISDAPILVKPEKVKHVDPPVSIPISKLNEVYNDTQILQYAIKSEYGDTITGKYICYDREGKNVDGCEYRFQYGDSGSKTVFLIWYNGKTIKWTNPPRLIFGLNEVKPGRPYLIVEGPKTREIASQHLPDFNVLTWNGGANNCNRVAWSEVIPHEATIYLYPDDDEVGIEAMNKIKSMLPNENIYTVDIIQQLRSERPKGADIVEAISFFHDDNLLKTHILSSGLPTEEHPTSDLDDFFSRRCLGQADDKTAYFIDASGRLENIRLKSLNKNVLMTLCPLSFWNMYYSTETKYGTRMQWDEAVSDVIQRSQAKDFDPDTTLGRGAWRNKDGSFCYHDGIDTIGQRDNNKHYLRKQKKDIGIEDTPASIETCQAIGRIALQMTFETKLDAIRTLSWSCLAPFAGALPWRPAVLLTGSSESGKTTIINTIITKIGIPQFYNGAETTPAGLRADLGNDACGVVFDETEGKEKAQRNREELFLVMRQSTSDDAPKICKSNKDQGIVKYEMKNMFLFSSIHAGIEDEADEKRILRVNIKKTSQHEDNWSNLEAEINKLITEENCRAIRALTWNRLDDIIKYAKELQHIIRRVTGLSSRSAFAESLIMSCYFLIWQGMETVTTEYAEATIASVYMHHEKEDRNESKETLDRILDETVYLPDARENKSLRQILLAVKSGDTGGKTTEYQETLERYGLRLMFDETGTVLAIQKDNVNISKNMNLGGGYGKILWRHNNLVERSRRVRMAGTLRTCITIKGVFDVDEC